jgi:hypothetical protein
MTLNHIFSLTTFALVALCFVAFVSTLKPQPLYASETAGQPAVDNIPKARLQRIEDECEETYGVNSSQSVDCFFITLAKRMAAEKAERTGSHPATRHLTTGRRRHGPVT